MQVFFSNKSASPWFPCQIKQAQKITPTTCAGRYEAAVDLAEAVLQGEGRAAAVRRALSGLATACMRRQVSNARPAGRLFSGTHPCCDACTKEAPELIFTKGMLQRQAGANSPLSASMEKRRADGLSEQSTAQAYPCLKSREPGLNILSLRPNRISYPMGLALI